MLNLFFRKQFVLSRELLVEDLKVMFFPLILDNKDTMAVQMGTAVPILSKSELCSCLFLGGKREKKVLIASWYWPLSVLIPRGVFSAFRKWLLKDVLNSFDITVFSLKNATMRSWNLALGNMILCNWHCFTSSLSVFSKQACSNSLIRMLCGNNFSHSQKSVYHFLAHPLTLE